MHGFWEGDVTCWSDRHCHIFSFFCHFKTIEKIPPINQSYGPNETRDHFWPGGDFFPSSLDTFHNSQDFMSRNPALNQFGKKHTSEREKIGMTGANMTIIRKCYYRESCSRHGWLMELGGLPCQSQLTTSLKESRATFSSKKKFNMWSN